MFRSSLYVWLFLGLALAPRAAAQSAENEPQWLAHLSANEQFKSEILLRNDDSDRALSLRLVFFDRDGEPAQVSLRDADGLAKTVSELELSLNPQAVKIISLQSVTGGDNRSVQAKVVVSGEGRLAVEANFNRFDNGQKTAKVGVAGTLPATLFRINVNASPDPVNGAVELRGLGVANTHGENPCDCLATLVDDRGFQLETRQITIPPNGKWLGVIGDLFPEGAMALDGAGHIDAFCGEAVVVLALSFEGSLMSTAPVTLYRIE